MPRLHSCLLCLGCCLGLLAGLGAQTPPANAHDISSQLNNASVAASPSTAAAAPSAVVEAPASVLRVYVDNLTGADATAIAGLITQGLFQSKQIVVTQNQSNASLILQGSIERAPVKPAARTASRTTHRRSATAAIDSSAPSGITAPVVDLDAAATPDLTLPGSLDAPVDLSKYQYRLDLRLVNPDGDLVWMSGRGAQALPLASADSAVQQTVAALLRQLASLTPTPAAH